MTLPRRVATACLCVGTWLCVLEPGRYVLDQFRKPPDPRWAAYEEAGHYVLAHSDHPVTAAAVEIGFFGYVSRARIVDLMGLVSPRAFVARQRGELALFVAEARPDFLLDAQQFDATYFAPLRRDTAITCVYSETARFSDARGGLADRLLRFDRTRAATCRLPSTASVDLTRW
jgi:hypothetical protein